MATTTATPHGILRACPYCGSPDLATDLECWRGVQTQDGDGIGLLEHQCQECGRSFFTPDDDEDADVPETDDTPPGWCPLCRVDRGDARYCVGCGAYFHNTNEAR